MKILFKIISYLFIAAVAAIALLLVVSALPGKLDVKVVKSGSMEPTIKTGGIVVIYPAKAYGVGDIITFGADTKTQIPTTHRIVGMETNGTSTGYLTKGDANDAPDPRTIEKREIIGKVVFTVPYLGYILDFARRPIGFMLLVGVPALMLIIDEVRKIITEVKKARKKKRRNGSDIDFTPPDASFDEDVRTSSSDAIRKSVFYSHKRLPMTWMPGFFIALQRRKQKARALQRSRVILSGLRSIVIALVAYGAFSGLLLLGGTVSYFSDEELTVGNLLRAGTVDITLQKIDSAPDGARVLGIAAKLSNDGDVTDTTSDEVPADEQTDTGPSGTSTFTLALVGGDTTVPLIYSLSSQLDEGMPEVCSTLSLAASYNDESYDGPLTAFSVEQLLSLGEMTFTVTLPDAATIDQRTLCSGTITVAAHIDGVSDEIDSLFGDSESFPFMVSGENIPVIPPPAILPVLPVDGDGGSTDPLPEVDDQQISDPPGPSPEEQTPPESDEPTVREELSAPPTDSAPSEPAQ